MKWINRCSTSHMVKFLRFMVFSDLSEKIPRSLCAIICINYDRFRFQLEVPVPVSLYRFSVSSSPQSRYCSQKWPLASWVFLLRKPKQSIWERIPHVFTCQFTRTLHNLLYRSVAFLMVLWVDESSLYDDAYPVYWQPNLRGEAQEIRKCAIPCASSPSNLVVE